MKSLTTDSSKYMKMFIVLSLIAMLSGCGDQESLIGQLGNNDAPSLTKAEIVISGRKGVMNLEYREGIVWPNVHTEVDVKEIPNGYEITRQDDKYYKLEFIESYGLSKIYICSECTDIYQNQMPVFWHLK